MYVYMLICMYIYIYTLIYSFVYLFIYILRWLPQPVTGLDAGVRPRWALAQSPQGGMPCKCELGSKPAPSKTGKKNRAGGPMSPNHRLLGVSRSFLQRDRPKRQRDQKQRIQGQPRFTRAPRGSEPDLKLQNVVKYINCNIFFFRVYLYISCLIFCLNYICTSIDLLPSVPLSALLSFGAFQDPRLP